MVEREESVHPLLRRPLRRLAWVFVLAAVVALVGRGLRAVRSATTEPGLGARWIWAEGSFEAGRPLAFYAVRDVFLEEAPEAAWMSVAVDESYVLHLNGQAVAGGVFRQGVAVDLYRVEAFLEAGWNRLVIEARSTRGAGGILASLRVGERDRVVVGSDASWRIFRRLEPGLPRGWDVAASGEEPRVWGSQAAGRWRPAPPGEELASRPLGPAWAPGAALQAREHPPDFPWRRPPAPGRRLPRLGPTAVFDWGRETSAYLELLLPEGGGEPSLIFYGLEPPDLHRDRPAEIMVPVPGADRWLSPRPRRFRYVLVAGVELRYPPRALPVPAEAELGAGTLEAPAGVFGLEPTLTRNRHEVEIWRRLSPP